MAYAADEGWAKDVDVTPQDPTGGDATDEDMLFGAGDNLKH
jgi:hypothetical protein